MKGWSMVLIVAAILVGGCSSHGFINEKAALEAARGYNPNVAWSAAFYPDMSFPDGSGPRPVWMLTANYPPDGRRVYMYIDGVTGQTIKVDEGPAGTPRSIGK